MRLSALLQQHIQRDADDDNAENHFDDAPVHAFEHQCAGNIARQHQSCQRQENSGIKRFSVLPGQNGVSRETENQLDGRNVCVVDAEAQYALKDERIGKAAKSLDKESRKGRGDEPRHRDSLRSAFEYKAIVS